VENLKAPNFRWEMRIVISMCLGYGMLMLCRTVVSVAGPTMLADPALSLDIASFGAILGWGTAGNLTGKLTTGVLADKLGGSRVFIWAVGIAAVTTFIFGSLTSNIAFFALYFLTVFAKSAGWPAMANIIRVGFVQAKHGRVWGFIATSSRISSVVTTILVSSLLFIMSWRGLFYIAGALALVSVFILPRYLKNSWQGIGVRTANLETSNESLANLVEDHPLSKTESRAAIGVFIRNPRFWLISLGVSSLAVLFEFQVFIPIFLSETFSLQPAQAGLASSAFPLGCLVAVFGGGFVYDKLSKKNIVYAMGASLAIAVLCLLGLRLLGEVDFGNGLELILTISLIFVFGFAISPAYYIPMSVFSIGFGGKHCGLLVGLIDAFAYFGAMMFDFIGGAVANKEGGWEDFILILIVTSIAAAIIMTTFLYLDYLDSERDLALPVTA
jgi:OPA family sugar phosphate sensor protein UhpC-like MFS transporter|tara:strand:- start:1926 stop:3251 length:1326 start_codon:yes stop_codon:yes gene_type:complete